MTTKALVFQKDWKWMTKDAYPNDKFDLVAEVNIPDDLKYSNKSMSVLDWAYEWTNTIDNYWWDNQNVIPKFEGEGCRSTSMWDLIKIDDGLYSVEACGFKPVDTKGKGYLLAKNRIFLEKKVKEVV